MEKFSQSRDRGSGVAPFLPIPSTPSGVYLPFHTFLFVVRLTFFVTLSLSYFAFLQWLPLGSLGLKAYLWSVFGISGLWWIDLQIDGVRRGALASNAKRLPGPGTVIAASFTSPLDILYLATIFDPIFTFSFPDTHMLETLPLPHAVLRAFSSPLTAPPLGSALTTLDAVLAAHPERVIVVFPECTTTNGRGILPFSSSLRDTPPRIPIFPVSLRYTAADVTTPLPGTYFTFLWNWLSRPTHVIRVRIAKHEKNVVRPIIHSSSLSSGSNTGNNTSAATPASPTSRRPRNRAPSVETTRSDSTTDTHLSSGDDGDRMAVVPPTPANESRVLDRVADALARLGRVPRVGLGVESKQAFIVAWTRSQRRR